jgi:hypothetical protein
LSQLAYEVYLEISNAPSFPSFSPTPFSFSQGSMVIIGSCIFKPPSLQPTAKHQHVFLTTTSSNDENIVKMYYILTFLTSIVAVSAECPNYEQFARERHEPFSSGRHAFPIQRPSKDCRTYSVPAVERVIYEEMDQAIGDPDLYRLFLNTWPNTLDTTVKWQGTSADNSDEEVNYASCTVSYCLFH